MRQIKVPCSLFDLGHSSAVRDLIRIKWGGQCARESTLDLAEAIIFVAPFIDRPRSVDVCNPKIRSFKVKLIIPMRNSSMLSADIYQTAFEFLERFGDSALVEAAMKSDAMLDQRDKRGVDRWNRVMEAIEELHATQLRRPH
jgi:hypothetical protein